jgi:hypothetical protein
VSSPTAIHEATHAVVALELGLSVRKVQLHGWIRVPKYCAQLYPGIITGMPIKSSICLLEEDCLDTNPGEVLIAMAAPSFLRTDDTKLNTYSTLEAMLAERYARKKTDLSPVWVLDRAQHYAALCENDVYDLADRLEERGVLQGEEL